MGKVSSQKETNTDNQLVIDGNKLKKVFDRLGPENPPEICPVRDVLSVVSDKWSILIVFFLGFDNRLRFNELKRKMNDVSSKLLTERLRRLERDGYIIREVFQEIPMRVEYSLNEMGIQYLKQLLYLADWIEEVTSDIISNRKKYDQS